MGQVDQLDRRAAAPLGPVELNRVEAGGGESECDRILERACAAPVDELPYNGVTDPETESVVTVDDDLNRPCGLDLEVASCPHRDVVVVRQAREVFVRRNHPGVAAVLLEVDRRYDLDRRDRQTRQHRAGVIDVRVGAAHPLLEHGAEAAVGGRSDFPDFRRFRDGRLGREAKRRRNDCRDAGRIQLGDIRELALGPHVVLM